jgi:hypothetical protein
MLLQNGRIKVVSLQPGHALSQARTVLASPLEISSFGRRVFTKASLHTFNREAFPYVCPHSFVRSLEFWNFHGLENQPSSWCNPQSQSSKNTAKNMALDSQD